MTLEIRDLSVSFGGHRVSHIPSLDLEPGRIVGLVGESGSGKSMSTNAILGLAERLGAIVTGSIRFDGMELVGASKHVLREVRGRRIAMIFQSPSTAFHPIMKVGDVFVRSLRLHGVRSRDEARARAESAIAEMLLPARVLDRYPHEMSGGQLQRVAIALALALDAEVLLADEPTSALDVTVQAEILTLLAQLRDRGRLATLLISHDLAAVAEIADTVAVMRGGEMVEHGPTASVIHSPTSAYTRELLAAVPVLGRHRPLNRQTHLNGENSDA
ncbi:ABC transporter ATP-binding protein [Homoserinimonas sp. OAct 916]|uniref:ABC transporter ATP-binding protein n=1 Tax=Homoserinimonas sp. OAct 916 TaxID=2211450 RepID=UPI000DBE178E|nr:ABC transporter ATP-binding protein [Homoserinimonas sp. OAct 916]